MGALRPILQASVAASRVRYDAPMNTWVWKTTIGALFLLVLCGWTLDAQQPAPAATPQPIRIGLIGLDTSHAGAFTQLLNDSSRADHIPGARVVAAFKGGSPDVEASATRIEKFTAELRDKWQIELVGSIDELVRSRRCRHDHERRWSRAP